MPAKALLLGHGFPRPSPPPPPPSRAFQALPTFQHCMQCHLGYPAAFNRVHRRAQAPLRPFGLGPLLCVPFCWLQLLRRPITGHHLKPWVPQAANLATQWPLGEFVMVLGASSSKAWGTPGAEKRSCQCWLWGIWAQGLNSPLFFSNFCSVVKHTLSQNSQSWVPQTAPRMAKPLELLVDSQQRCFGPTKVDKLTKLSLTLVAPSP